MADFRSKALETKVDRIITIVNEIFGEEPYRETIFDQWWILEISLAVEKIYYVEERILPDEIKKLSKTGNVTVDRYIDSLLQEPDDDDE